MARRQPGWYTIAQAVELLRREFPVSAASLRYLEKKGIVTPHRTEGGHRLYDEDHLARLRLALMLQRHRYMNTAAIRRYCQSTLPIDILHEHTQRVLWLMRPLRHQEDFQPLTRQQLAEALGASVSRLLSMEEAGLIWPCNEGDPVPLYDEDALELARYLLRFESYGIREEQLASFLILGRQLALSHLHTLAPALYYRGANEPDLMEASEGFVQVLYHRLLRQAAADLAREGQFHRWLAEEALRS